MIKGETISYPNAQMAYSAKKRKKEKKERKPKGMHCAVSMARS